MKNERHAARRAQIEAERAERRRIEEEQCKLRSRKLKSKGIPAKWHWKGGIALGGVKIRGGKFYAGANMSSMVEPRLFEPSLLSPLYPIADSTENMIRLDSYPCYQYLTEEQRRGYVEFLASSRDSTEDIGFVFLYLYGLERRLVLDASKPGEVSEEEREDIIRELIRLLNVFSNQSRSLAHYIAMLLLYDGHVFDMLGEDELRDLFKIDDIDQDPLKLMEGNENVDAMAYLLVSRFKSHKMDVPSKVIALAGIGRLTRSSNISILGIEAKSLYDPVFMKMLMERVDNVKTNREAKSARSVGKPNRPVYYPSSIGLRRGHSFEITSKIAKDPEEMGIPLKKIADIAVSCRKELDEYLSVIESSSKRGIEDVALDAIVAAAPENCAVEKFLEGKKTATFASVKVFDDDIRRRFGTSLTYTAKGILSLASQQMIAVIAAAYGWQAMLPETIESQISSTWKINEDDKIVLFRRGIGHDNRNGKRCLGPIFGGDSSSFHIVLPGSWNEPAALSYVFAWFVDRCSTSLSSQDLMKFSATYNPKWVSSGKVELQHLLFYSMRYATYSLNLSTHGIKSCLAAARFEHVQDIVFSLVNDVFGNMIPEDVMAALEEIYRKAGQDKSMVLYDYHAGTYHVVADTDTGFSIDGDRLAETIADTSNVHSILNEAMKTGSDDEIILDDKEKTADDETSSDDDSNNNNNEVSDTDDKHDGNSVDGRVDLIREIFDGEDEMATADLTSKLMEVLGLSSSAEVMSWIADLNADIGKELIEIDGADAYLNE